MPTLPLDSGMCFTNQSMVSQASVRMINVAVGLRRRERGAT